MSSVKICWLALLIALLPAGHAATAESVVRVVVKDAYAHGLAVGLGELLDQDIAIASYSGRRLTINDKYNSADELYSSLAKQLGGILSKKDEVTFIQPSCLAPAISGTDVPLSPERAAFNFDLIRADLLLEVFARQNDLPFQAQEPALHSSIIGLRLKGASHRAVHDIVARATGAILRRRGAYVVVDVAGNIQCAEKFEVSRIPGVPRNGDCPSKLIPYAERRGRNVSCEPLEAYPLHELRPRGFVDIAERRFVVLEAADHGTFFIKEGGYLGHQLGVLYSIDDEGFVVREAKQDSSGLHYFSYTRIDYSNRQTSLPREYK